MIAALFVATNGCYFGVPDVDSWDEVRDARRYSGPWAVVAHPPCARWCRLAGLVEKRWGLAKGDDGGCFASALASVRRWGGVLEHPAWSNAWAAHDLPVPTKAWQRDIHGGWCCSVEQRWYGHRATKATWLYAVGAVLPSLRWNRAPAPTAWLDGDRKGVARMGKRERSATPVEFRDLLIAMARSVTPAAMRQARSP